MYTPNFRMVALAALAIAVSGAMVKASPVGGAQPEQAWATKSGLVALLPQSTVQGSAVQTTAAPMARLLIEDAFSRYAVALDEGRRDVLKSLFTEDARVEIVEGSNKPLVAVAGRDVVLVNFASAWKQQGEQRRHVISNIVFNQLTDSHASLIAYGVVIVANDGLSIGTSIIYTAELRRDPDGAWRFSRLLVGMDKYVGQKPHAPK
jgi:hypothetical protein